MTKATEVFKAQFDFQTRLFNNVLEHITDAEAATRGSDHINHMKWVAGHLLNTRVGSMSRIAGLQPDNSYEAQFARGTTLDTSATYPSIDEITTKWKATAPALSAAIAAMPDEVLSAPSNANAPIADDTVRGLMSFLLSHESLHIGQLSLLRKLAGKDAMSFK